MSIKRTGGRKPTMGNWRASIWPRANMQYVNVVISMGICIWMHARYTGASLPSDTRVWATCALGLTLARHPRYDAALHTFVVSSVLRPSISANIARAAMQRIGARICECIFHLRPDWTRFRIVCTQFQIDREWTAVLKLRRKIFITRDIAVIIKKYNRIILKVI